MSSRVDKSTTELTPEQIRVEARRWYERQVAVLQACHGKRWPDVQEWLEGYLREQLRQRLMELGWRPKR